MTAIAAIQKGRNVMLVSDGLITMGAQISDSFPKVFYGDNYMVAFSGTIPLSLANYVEENIKAVAAASNGPVEIINAIKTYIETGISPMLLQQISMIAVKDGEVKYMAQTLAGFITHDKDVFKGIGSGGVALATTLGALFDGQDPFMMEEADVRALCEKAMQSVTLNVAGVGRSVKIYRQKAGGVVSFDGESSNYHTAEFANTAVAGKKKKIYAFVASDKYNHSDKQILGVKALQQIAQSINEKTTPMDYVGASDKHSVNNDIIGLWHTASLHKCGRKYNVVKAVGEVHKDMILPNELSASIFLRVNGREYQDGNTVISDVDVKSISLTDAPVDPLCVTEVMYLASDNTDEDLFICNFSINLIDENIMAQDAPNNAHELPETIATPEVVTQPQEAVATTPTPTVDPLVDDTAEAKLDGDLAQVAEQATDAAPTTPLEPEIDYKTKYADIEKELSQARSTQEEQSQIIQTLTDKLIAIEVSKSAAEKELAKSRKIIEDIVVNASLEKKASKKM